MKLGVAAFAAVGMALACGAFTAGQAALVVSPDGLSPHAALEKIRAEKAKGDKSAWTVRVKPGRYVLAKPLVFTPADSGTPEAPVTWAGEAGAEFAGGAAITGWQKRGDGVWAAPVPKAPDGKPAYFEQLWVNGRRADRARFPNAGEPLLRIAQEATEEEVATNRFVETAVFTNDVAKAMLATLAPEDLPSAQMCVVQRWSFARRTLRGVDAEKGTVTTEASIRWKPWYVWTEKESLVWFENVRSAFDAPGEWFYDAKAGEVLYRPLPGEDLAAADVVAPSSRLSRLVEFRGDPDAGAFVHDVAFANVAFAYSAPPGGKNGPTQNYQWQAAMRNRDAAVVLVGARRVAFKACAIRHTGDYGLRIDNGSTSNRVENCVLEDLGAGGVAVGADDGYAAEGETLTRRVIRSLAPRSVAFNVIDNCTIRQGGRFNPEGTGVAVTHASDCVVRHCDIYDFYYTGVSVGWKWGYAGSVAQRNEIAYNRIYDLGKGVMSDMGGVYTLGTSFGTRVHDNVIHDVKSYSYGGWALYTDEGSEGIVMERNVCWNTTDGGFHQHYGVGNLIRNNVFAWNLMTGAVRTERGEVQGVPSSLDFVNNIVIVREGPLTSDGVCNVGGVWANNLWWDVSGKPKFLGGKLDWAGWAASGKETGGVYADPQFRDAEAFDFRLKPTSPALKLGFRPWDMSAAGRKQDLALVNGEAEVGIAALPRPWMPDPKTLGLNRDRVVTFDRPLPRLMYYGAGETRAPGDRNRQIGTYNNTEFAYPGLLSTAGSGFGEMMAQLRRIVRADRRLVFVDGRTLVCQNNWIRDHVHQSKAFCHWEYDNTSFLDFILDTQREDGQFFELVKQWTDYHWTLVTPDCARLFPDDAQTLVRIELEADVEYLVVEGCLQAWRATGDDAWLKRVLPRLEKAIDYQTSCPKRWDVAHGLCMRPYTIDTWDFLAVAGVGDRRVNLDGPMTVMHGDNTGVYQAMRQLAFVNRRFGNDAKAAEWERRAATLKANVMKHLYNGRFFVHQLPLNCPPVDGHESERLTLSDAYALNRGIWTPEQNRACIEEYLRRRRTVDAFAEWYTIDPAIDSACYNPGQYVNGAISPFTAGELAKGAFENGYEAYGYDILMRIRELVARDGGNLYFLYDPKTREPQGRGPSGWGAAAILSAIDQGLAGIQDTDKLYRTMRFAPRWAVTEHREGRYVTGYEVSKKNVDVRWVFKDGGFRYRLACPSEKVEAHLLVPAGKTPRTLRVNGKETAFALSDVFGSKYVDVTVTPANGLADFEVLY